MPKDSPKKIGIYVALFFTLVALLVYFLKPAEKTEDLPRHLGRFSALKAYQECKSGQTCVKTHVISNLKMINSNATEFIVSPYSTIYVCNKSRLAACEGGRVDSEKLSEILYILRNTRTKCYLYSESGEKVVLSSKEGVFMNSEKVFGFSGFTPKREGYVSLVVEQHS
jgi:hypothetical protein